MKKFQLFLMAALITAAASAFTTIAPTLDEYVLINGRFELVSEQPAGGLCSIQENSVCKYEKTGNDGTDPYTVPANFSPLDSDMVWVP